MISRRPSTSSRQPSIQLHIECLVLDGLPISRSQGAEIQAIVETELARMLDEEDLSHLSEGAAPRVSDSTIKLSHNSKPAQLGHMIARAIHGTLAPAPALSL